MNNLVGVHTQLAQALALLGDVDGARRALATAEGRSRPAQRLRIRFHHERALATIEAASGLVSAARDRMLSVAADVGEDRHATTEALFDALRYGADPAACAARLEPIAAEAQDESVRLYARLARALADDDVAATLAVAERLEELGLQLAAAEAAAFAVPRAERQALRDASRRAATLVARCRERCPGVTTPALAAPVEGPALTGREREIAGLAARGLSNAQIAEQLVLSVRSVETYVLRACRKLGVTSRTDLAQVLPEG